MRVCVCVCVFVYECVYMCVGCLLLSVVLICCLTGRFHRWCYICSWTCGQSSAMLPCHDDAMARASVPSQIALLAGFTRPLGWVWKKKRNEFCSWTEDKSFSFFSHLVVTHFQIEFLRVVLRSIFDANLCHFCHFVTMWHGNVLDALCFHYCVLVCWQEMLTEEVDRR